MDTNIRKPILVAEDSTAMRGAIQGFLRQEGFTNIALAPDGVVAWNLLNKAEFDLVISDWMMPRMSGLDVLKNMRQSEFHEHIPFLMITIRDKADDILMAKKYGVSDYIIKPFTAKLLLEKVKMLLNLD